MNIVIFGLPGSGKDVQGNLLTKQHNLTVISPGEIFRQEIKANSPLGKKIKTIINSGGLLPDSTVAETVQKKIEKQKNETCFLFNGYPRTLQQAKLLHRQLANQGKQVDLCIYLKVSPEEVMERLQGRKIIKKRLDDDDSIVKRRILLYKSYCSEIIRYYDEQKKLVHINGKKSIEEVNKDINQAISEYLTKKNNPCHTSTLSMR
ncbi:MAG: adenylate kinase family protein [Cytophagales bacterium]